MSKFILLVTIAISTFQILSSQTINKLDEKYGIKSLKFNSPQNFTKLKEVEGQNENPNIKVYLYLGNDLHELFGVSVESVELTYYKNKLMSVYVIFKDTFSESELNTIIYSLQQLYGDGDFISINDSNFSNSVGRQWKAKKVNLEVSRFYYKNSSSWGGYLSIFEKTLRLKSINDDF